MRPALSQFAHIRRHWAVFLGLAVALAVWCAVDVSRRARVDPAHPGLHMTDVTVYTEAGKAFFDGRQPYEVANLRGWKYLYPPLFALLMAPLAKLATPWQASVWFAVSALMCFGCYFECRRLMEWCRTPALPDVAGSESDLGAGALPLWFPIAAGTAAILPTLNCLQRGQMGVALLYFLLLGFRLVFSGRTAGAWVAGGAVLSLPVALKLTPLLPAGAALFVAFVAALDGRGIRQHRWRLSRPVWSSGGFLSGGVVCLLLFPASVIGWNDNLRHLATWYEKVATKVNDVRSEDFGGDVDSPRNQSLSNGVYRLGNWVAYEFAGGPYDFMTGKAHGAMPMDAPLVSRGLLAVRVLGLLALLGAAIRAGRSGDRRLWGVAFGLAAAATLVVSPVARGHYFMFLLPAALFLPRWLIETGKRRAAFYAAVVPAALVAAHYVLLDYAGRIGVLGIGTAVWYFAACGRVLFKREAVGAGDSHTAHLPAPARAA